MEKIIIVFIVTVLIPLLGNTQSLTPSTVSASGGYFEAGNSELSFTVAEMTMVQTFSSSNNILTQGFQQPDDSPEDVPVTMIGQDSILIYPNPTSGFFTLNFPGLENSEMTLTLYNITGQAVLIKKLSQGPGMNSADFDIRSFDQGMYLLSLSTDNPQGEKITIYKKIELVY